MRILEVRAGRGRSRHPVPTSAETDKANLCHLEMKDSIRATRQVSQQHWGQSYAHPSKQTEIMSTQQGGVDVTKLT